MHKNSTLVRARIERFIGERVRPALYRDSVALDLTAWEVPDVPEWRSPGWTEPIVRRYEVRR